MKKLLLTALAGIMMLALGGCGVLQTAATPVDATAIRNKVLVAEYAYTAVGKVALEYINWGRCGRPTSKPLCSEQSMVDTIRRVDNIAYAAVTGAETAARKLGANATIGDAAWIAAETALDKVADFRRIVQDARKGK